MKSKKIYIKGMHCPSCEKIIRDEFLNVAGVKDIKIDRKRNRGELFYEDHEPDIEELNRIAKPFGYQIFEKPQNVAPLKNNITKKSMLVWAQALLIAAVILLLYRFFINMGLLTRIAIGSTQITYGVAFLVGLVASVSSCLAVVGGVVLAFSEKYQARGENFFENAVRPNLLFQIGRLGTFFVLGGLLGSIGGELHISGNFVSFFTIAIAIVMGWLGLNILGLVPNISRMGLAMPQKLTSRWSKLKTSEQKTAPFMLGALSFFLPCGFTQSMQLFALASGSFLVGGLSLFLFALGTLPSLLAIGVAASWTKSRNIAVFQKVAGLLILTFAIFSLNSGLALRGVSSSVISSGSAKQKNLAEDKNDQNLNKPTPGAGSLAQDQASSQTVTMNVTASGFQPSVITLRQGVPVRWVINGQDVSGCTSTIIIPSFNISKSLQSGTNIVEFTPQKQGDIPFSCGMGMVRGKFIVK
jgi:sulfite exporter TauE/SafE/copper chaperone CopZ